MTAEQASKLPARRLREWEVRFPNYKGKEQRIQFKSESCHCLTPAIAISRDMKGVIVELWSDKGELYQAFKDSETVMIGIERAEQLESEERAAGRKMIWRLNYEWALMRNQPADPYDHGPGCSARISGKGNG